MIVIALDIGVVGLADLVEGAEPEVARVGQDVRLVYQREQSAALSSLLLAPAEVEGEAQTALDPETSGDHLLGRHLLRGAMAQEAPRAAIQVLGVLADDVEVDVVGALVLERAVHARVELHRPQVDVLVELEAQAQQEPFLEDARLDVGVAHGSEQNGVECAQPVDVVFVDDVPARQITIATEIELLGGVFEALESGDRSQYLDGLHNDLGARSVSGQDCQFERHLLTPLGGRTNFGAIA